MAINKEERERNKSILLAALNYLIEFHSGDMVFDGYSPSKEWYLDEIRKTESDIKESRSEQIKKRLDMHMTRLKYQYYLGINQYIRENTIYSMDIFDEFRNDVVPILTKSSIDNNDPYLIERYLKAYEKHPDEQENVRILKALLAKREAEINELISLGLVKTAKVSLTVGMNQSAVHMTDDQKSSNNWLLYEKIAPNGIFKLSVQISGKEKYALTYVNISLAGGTGCVYSAKGEKLPINVYWKDDRNVVIETKKEYVNHCKYKQVSSYDEVFNIEYRDV